MRKIDFFGSVPAREGSIEGRSLQSRVTNFSNSARATRYLFLFFSNHSRLLLRARDLRKESMLSIQLIIDFIQGILVFYVAHDNGLRCLADIFDNLFQPDTTGGFDEDNRVIDLCRLQRTAEIRLVGEVMRLREDRKSTRLNSSHVKISYAVFC